MNYMALDEAYEVELQKRKKEVAGELKEKEKVLNSQEIVNRASGQERGE